MMTNRLGEPGASMGVINVIDYTRECPIKSPFSRMCDHLVVGSLIWEEAASGENALFYASYRPTRTVEYPENIQMIQESMDLSDSAKKGVLAHSCERIYGIKGCAWSNHGISFLYTGNYVARRQL